MAPNAAKKDEYEPKDAVRTGTLYGALGLGGGFFYAATQNALSRENRGALGVFTKSGGVMLLCAVGPAIFGFTEAAAGNLRGKDDHWNTTIGAFLGGTVPGLIHKRVSVMLGIGAFMGATFGTLAYTGNRLDGWKRFNEDDDEYASRMSLKMAKRSNLDDTIATIGEGRGVYPSGYEERRRERIKQKYGIEVNTVKATAD